MVQNTGLVLEGGGMRGLYTAGVLEYFMENDLFFPYVIGVSAGACMAASYLSKQKGRNKAVNIEYASHPKYISYKNLFIKQELFGMDFLFDEIPNKLVPFDYETFDRETDTFLIGTTDCDTGEAVYFNTKEYKEDVLNIMRASSSLPFMAPVVKLAGKNLLDGGIADPIPIRKSIEDGNTKHVVVLTRNADYKKKKTSMEWLLQRKYKEYGGLIQAVMDRYKVYNDTVSLLQELEQREKVWIIRPSMPLKVRRVEKKRAKLSDLYNLGYTDAKQHYEPLLDWLSR